MLLFFTIFLQIFLLTITNQVYGQFEDDELHETSSCQERALPGYICNSCDVLEICLKLSNRWINIPVENCDTEKGFYCNSNLGSCSNATGPCHPFSEEGSFLCTSSGVFPDPYDCQKYHVCYFVDKVLSAATVKCVSDKAFNPATGECSLFYYDQICSEPQFYCDRAGDARPWPGNSNIFYVCHVATNEGNRVLYPTLYRCNAGEIFNGYICKFDDDNIDNNKNFTPHKSTIRTTTSTPKTSSTTRRTMETTEANLPPSMIKCSQVGLHADLKDCQSYFYCSAINGSVKHAKCPTGTFYNSAVKSCVLGSCTN